MRVKEQPPNFPCVEGEKTGELFKSKSSQLHLLLPHSFDFHGHNIDARTAKRPSEKHNDPRVELETKGTMRAADKEAKRVEMGKVGVGRVLMLKVMIPTNRRW